MWVNRNNRTAGMPSSTERRTIFTMAKILRQNVGGVDFTVAGCALTGVCPTAAADYVKQITLSDGDVIEDGMMMVVTFANGNTAGNAPNTKTIYSSDQVNYFEDDQLTVPFTLAPAGCYDIEYTGTANAYTYTDYPVFQVGSVSGPVCDYRGHITSGDLWEAGDSVQCMLKEGKFLLLGGAGGADIEVYDTVQDAIDDLPNLKVDQYIATKDTGSELSAPVDTVQSGNMHAITSNAVAESLGRINVLSEFAYFVALNTDITVSLTEDIQDETILHIVLGTMINQSSEDIRLCDCPILISKRLTNYIYTFYEARSNTQVMGIVKPYVMGSKQLVLNFFSGNLSVSDRYCVFSVIKG